MKILLIGEYTSPHWIGSATQKVQRGLLKSLSKNNETYLFDFQNKKKRFEKLFSPIKKMSTLHGLTINGGVVQLVLFILRDKPDIIHFVVQRNYMFYILPFLLFHNNICVTLHDTIDFQRQQKSALSLLKTFLILMSRIVFVYSKFDQEIIGKRFKNSKKLKLVRNGIEEITVTDNSLVSEAQILFAGGIGNNYKGLSYLKDALKRIRFQHKLMICGQKKTDFIIENYLGELEPDQFYKLLKSCSVLAVPSSYESFSIAALEALCLGVPLIITKNAGISFYLQNNYDALIVEYGNINQLKDAIESVLKEDMLSEKLIENGQKTAKSFLWDNIIESDYLKNYNSIIYN